MGLDAIQQDRGQRVLSAGYVIVSILRGQASSVDEEHDHDCCQYNCVNIQNCIQLYGECADYFLGRCHPILTHIYILLNYF